MPIQNGTQKVQNNYPVRKICICENNFVSLHHILKQSPKSVAATTEQG